jgi:hypothetical protein
MTLRLERRVYLYDARPPSRADEMRRLFVRLDPSGQRTVIELIAPAQSSLVP